MGRLCAAIKIESVQHLKEETLWTTQHRLPYGPVILYSGNSRSSHKRNIYIYIYLNGFTLDSGTFVKITTPPNLCEVLHLKLFISLPVVCHGSSGMVVRSHQL